MKKYWVLLMTSLVLAAWPAWAARTMNVQVREAVVRDRPSFMGAIAGRLEYGDQAGVIAEQGAWSQVRAGAIEGWVHTSALTRKTITRPVGGETLEGTASAGEVALAGKGFNRQVEDEYRKQNQQLDFGLVDRIERQEIDEREIADFLQRGGLTKGGAL